MISMMVWLLISTSNGPNNIGTQSTLAMFANEGACTDALTRADRVFARLSCVRAYALVPK